MNPARKAEPSTGNPGKSSNRFSGQTQVSLHAAARVITAGFLMFLMLLCENTMVFVTLNLNTDSYDVHVHAVGPTATHKGGRVKMMAFFLPVTQIKRLVGHVYLHFMKMVVLEYNVFRNTASCVYKHNEAKM